MDGLGILTEVVEFDSSIFTIIVDGAKEILSLFTVFPLNIFLGASLVGLIVSVIRKLKRT